MHTAPLVGLDKLNPAEAWGSWRPSSKEPWDLKRVGHLYRRAGFGADFPDLRRGLAEGLPKTLDRLFAGDLQLADRDRFYQREESDVTDRDAVYLRGWWLDRMLNGGHPLREKLTLFWHNHFATSITKVVAPGAMLAQNELLRRHALGKFGPMLQAVSKDPAMLVWLDSNSNVKGKPNENYAREVMELFSLGVGSYTETDIREAARAFTGWHTDGQRFTFKPDEHDDGVKTVLGRTGPLDGGDVVGLCLDQPACARFLVRKLYRSFVSETQAPPDAFLEPLADAYRKSGYDTALVLRQILESRHFFSAHAYRQRVKSPVEYVLGLVRALGQGMVASRALVPHLELMGQHLFAPPNVKGWEGSTAWLNTATVLARHNFAHGLTLDSSRLNLGDPEAVIGVAFDVAAIVRLESVTGAEPVARYYLDLLVQGDVSDDLRERVVAYLSAGAGNDPRVGQRVREAVHALLTTPEYQLA
jgi:uncharacterized protein (DUF1800 family)